LVQFDASCTVENFVFLRKVPFQPPRRRRQKPVDE